MAIIWSVFVCVRVRGGVVRLKLGVQGQGSGRILDVDVQGELGVLKIGQLENFHGRHMSIIPNEIEQTRTGQENFNVCFSVLLYCYCQSFISGKETGY